VIYLKFFLLTAILFQTLLFGAYTASIVDKDTNKPITNAIISDSRLSVKSDENGEFSIDTNETTLHVKACGYRNYKINNNKSIIKLEPFNIKALYLGFWRASNNSNRLKEVLKIIDKTEVNAIVIDIKNEYGSIVYKTSFKQADSYGAHKDRTNKNIKQFMRVMKSKNIYTIARIVTFKDELQASKNPHYAIKNVNGELWRNHDNIAWVDPFDVRAHEYTISIAKEAAKVGFDEINFDYIRFPAKSGLLYSKKNTQENRLKAISDFLALAQDRLRKYGVFISVDTYGNVCWSGDDNNIGQTVESLSVYADYLAPMLYPSGFASGSFGFKYPSEHPHAVIYRSIKNIKDRIDLKRIRPWLQHFKDYAHTKKHYKKFEVNEQIRATEDIQTNGWMMWSPSSKYFLNYFIKEDK
jgi:hypothetical protein